MFFGLSRFAGAKSTYLTLIVTGALMLGPVNGAILCRSNKGVTVSSIVSPAGALLVFQPSTTTLTALFGQLFGIGCDA
jgi:hypothetical protein